jgi:alcohol dehydrogenase
LVVTDSGVAATGLPERVRSSLLATGFAAGLWDGVAVDPDEAHVERCGELLRAGGYDAVVAVGGGSVIDAAKVASILPTNGGRAAHYYGFDRVRRPGLPLVTVPTTAGSGAEVSSHAVIVRSEPPPKKKEVVSSLHLLARAAVIDPRATATLPPAQAVCCALDGLVHAIEAFLGRQAIPFTDIYATLAVPRIVRNLPRLLDCGPDGGDSCREELSVGCLYAGLAMANAGAGAIHALGYPLTSGYGIPHGIANALMAAAVLEWIGPSCRERLAELSLLVGAGPAGEEDREVCSLPQRLSRLIEDLGIRLGLAERGIAEADLPLLAEEASRFRPLLENTPVALTTCALLSIYRSAWQPAPPDSLSERKEHAT